MKRAVSRLTATERTKYRYRLRKGIATKNDLKRQEVKGKGLKPVRK